MVNRINRDDCRSDSKRGETSKTFGDEAAAHLVASGREEWRERENVQF
jgi:hypothetical protein